MEQQQQQQQETTLKEKRRQYAKAYYQRNKDTIKQRLKERYADDQEFKERRKAAATKYHMKKNHWVEIG